MGLCVPGFCLGVLVVMEAYERWLLGPARADRPRRLLIPVAVALAVTVGSELVDLADDRAALGPIAHVGLALGATVLGALLDRRRLRLAVLAPFAVFLPLVVFAVTWQLAIGGFTMAEFLQAAPDQLAEVALGVPWALAAAACISAVRWREALL